MHIHIPNNAHCPQSMVSTHAVHSKKKKEGPGKDVIIGGLKLKCNKFWKFQKFVSPQIIIHSAMICNGRAWIVGAGKNPGDIFRSIMIDSRST